MTLRLKPLTSHCIHAAGIPGQDAELCLQRVVTALSIWSWLMLKGQRVDAGLSLLQNASAFPMSQKKNKVITYYN